MKTGCLSSKRLPLPRRFNAALTEKEYERLRSLNDRYGLSNNYLLVVLLERLDNYADSDALGAAFNDFVEEYGAPQTTRSSKEA